MLAPGTLCLWLVSPCVVSFSTRNRISAVIIIFIGILSLLGLPHTVTKNSAVSCMYVCVAVGCGGHESGGSIVHSSAARFRHSLLMCNVQMSGFDSKADFK